MATGSEHLTASARPVEGSLRQEISVGRHLLHTDEPRRFGGDDSAPSPHELLPAALAGCIATHLVMYARTKQWELGELSVEVAYEHRATPRRFHVEVSFGAELSDLQLARLRAVAAACPVRRALAGGAEFDERFRSGGTRQAA